MVHARTFSFTDSSINVTFPAPSTKDTTTQHPISGPQSSDPALLLFSLRRAQSCWYQELYQSHSKPPDQTRMIWKMCHDMREWGETLPSTLSLPIRQMFDQELRYSYVYCIASSNNMGMTDYQRLLMFEYCLAYLDNMHGIATHNGGLNSAFYTFMDALKVYFMASQLVGVLWEIEDLIVSGHRIPVPPTRPGDVPPPPIPRRPVMPGMPLENNVHKSLGCLERVAQTLTNFGERWNGSALLVEGFNGMARDVMDRLRNRANQQQQQQQQQHQQQHQHQHQHQQQHQQHQQQQQHRQHQQQHPHPHQQHALYSNGQVSMQMPQQQQQQQHHHQQPQQQAPPREMRWVGVDVAQMMRGGPPR